LRPPRRDARAAERTALGPCPMLAGQSRIRDAAPAHLAAGISGHGHPRAPGHAHRWRSWGRPILALLDPTLLRQLDTHPCVAYRPSRVLGRGSARRLPRGTDVLAPVPVRALAAA